jgi:hypothetical protein
VRYQDLGKNEAIQATDRDMDKETGYTDKAKDTIRGYFRRLQWHSLNTFSCAWTRNPYLILLCFCWVKKEAKEARKIDNIRLDEIRIRR